MTVSSWPAIGPFSGHRHHHTADLHAMNSIIDTDPPERPRISRGELLEPVTNQVTSTSGHGRRSSTHSDTDIRLACGNRTQCDAIRRNWQAWHARGQGFESPKLHVSAAQKHIPISKMIFDFLHCTSCRWPLTSGSGTGVLARQSTPANPGRQPVPLEGRSREPKREPMVIGVSGREHVSESQLPGKVGSPSPTRSHLHSGNLRVDARLPSMSARTTRRQHCWRCAYWPVWRLGDWRGRAVWVQQQGAPTAAWLRLPIAGPFAGSGSHCRSWSFLPGCGAVALVL
jgi:hypothetical protein